MITFFPILSTAVFAGRVRAGKVRHFYYSAAVLGVMTVALPVKARHSRGINCRTRLTYTVNHFSQALIFMN